MRTFEYRIYPNKEQRHLLMECLMESRHIYNDMLERVKVQYEQSQTMPGKYELEDALQKCSKCGELVQKSLSVRTHICPFCSYIADRDHNAAQNILQRALGQGMAFERQRTPLGDA